MTAPTPSTTLPDSVARPRGRRMRTAALTVAGLSILASACSTSATGQTGSDAAGRREVRVTSSYGGRPAPGRETADQVARAASRDYSTQVEATTASFVDSIDSLVSDADAGDITAARADELHAQAEFDVFRNLETDDDVNASTLDELATDVTPGESFGGLHAVERDLWSTGPLAADVVSVAAQAPVVQLVLSREHLGPEAIGTVAVDELSWVADVALPENQELYSGLGLVDVAATVGAAAQAMTDIEPLARRIDPTLTAAVTTEFAALEYDMAGLGSSEAVPEASIAAPARLALSQQLDATASNLARLAAALAPYGTEGAPS